MSAQDRPSPDARICGNCRFLSFAPGAGLRCAGRAVQARQSCSRFEISFAAAKLLAVRSGAATLAEPWEVSMHRHLSAGGAPS